VKAATKPWWLEEDSMGQDKDTYQPIRPSLWCDPRLYQIASLSTLLIYGLFFLHFDLSIWQVIVTLSTAQLTQYAASRYLKLPAFDPKSALISSLSLCLLLRTNDLSVASLAAVIAIGSKFVIRWNNKHIFNPTNLALVVVLTSGLGWISPGQWGQVAWFGFLIACFGSLVITRAARADVTLAFLVFYIGLLVMRALWLGDPLTIPLHQIQSGALLIFAFFMISDPKTTPDSRTGRILFALIVALAALYVQFGLFNPNGPLWGLIVCAPLVPVLDRLFPGIRYDWSKPTTGRTTLSVPLSASYQSQRRLA
jgi:Na+-transporting NADH:ubiquinone oxidoreductase subunit NqrB